MCECVTGVYFSYKVRIIKANETKLVSVVQFCRMHICIRFRGFPLCHFEEIEIESWQDVSTLPADKLSSFILFLHRAPAKYRLNELELVATSLSLHICLL